MLVLTRKPNQTIIIDHDIVVRVLRIDMGRVRLGIEAPQDVDVMRGELVGQDDNRPTTTG